ncbi:MAG: hypothetical protein EAZ70_00335 [Runella slithyformis]|nr:MAG: hypothetical protein EAY79_00730 [Runella slithyformis]TAF94386.1 MAG: hypothetical protein EAZ46_10515 [Runella sp.]TAG18047.1 MAG: hypothetical protein EAZ38_15970 [Cytophagales bacterium]TAG37586.1 MAG: hypothetical protein EAZ32_14920 [Cytophagia bacterium]TAE99384.1 MAG: hypothetical protein EAZ80_04980 [Runella slithyformis]
MKLFLAFTFAVFSFGTYAQKVDLDRFSFDYSHLKLPQEYVEPAKRTYGVRVETDAKIVPADAIYDRIRLSGYQLVESKPTVGVLVYFSSFLLTGAELRERIEEVKDKEGRVTSKKYFYLMQVSYRSQGGYKITGPTALGAQKAKEQEKVVSTNRFLQKAEGLDNTDNNKTIENNTGTFGNTYNTREFNNAREAREYYRDNQLSIKDAIVGEWVAQTTSAANNQLAQRYGFEEVRGRDHLWILDSNKHPEYATQQEAIKAVKTLMATMNSQNSISSLATNLAPVMEYFQELKTKYKLDEKPDRKMRYSAYYNLACLYYYLDQPEKMMEEAEGLIKNDYDTRDGRRFIELAQELRADLDRQKTNSRHFE